MALINLISCSSYRLLDEEIKKITKDNPFTTIDYNVVTMEDIINEAAYVSLFDDKKYIVIKNCNLFNVKRGQKVESGDTPDDSDKNKTSNEEELLLKYMDSPNENTVLIFGIYTKPAGTKKIVKKIKDNFNLITLTDMNYKEIQDRIIKYFKDHKYTYDKDVPYYICTSCQNNYDLVFNELDKIDLYYGKPGKVTMEDVSNIISKPLEDSNFKFLDAVLDRNLNESMRILNDLLIQKVAPVMLLVMLSKEYRNTLYVLHYRNYNKQDLMAKTGIKYEFQIDKIINRSYLYKESEIEDILLYIAELNYKMTTSRVDHKTALELLILKVCK